MGPHVSKTTTEELREKNFPGPGKFFPCFMVGGPCAQIERLTGNNVNYRKFKTMGPYISKTTTESFMKNTSPGWESNVLLSGSKMVAAPSHQAPRLIPLLVQLAAADAAVEAAGAWEKTGSKLFSNLGRYFQVRSGEVVLNRTDIYIYI